MCLSLHGQQRMPCRHGEEPSSSIPHPLPCPLPAAWLAGRLPHWDTLHSPRPPSLPPQSAALAMHNQVSPFYQGGIGVPASPLHSERTPADLSDISSVAMGPNPLGMCTMAAFCLRNWSPYYFPWVFSGKQPRGASRQRCHCLTPSPQLLPSALPAAEAASQQREEGRLPPPLLARAWIRPQAQFCEVFLRLFQLFQRFPLSEAAVPAMSKPGGGEN